MTLTFPIGSPVEDVVRTLLAAGGEIVDFDRHGRHVEISVDMPTIFGTRSGFLVGITEGSGFTDDEIASISAEAKRSGRSLLLAATTPGERWQSISDLLDALGGAVPSWRALEATFENALITTSTNALPSGLNGEAWQLFEDLVADGLEYLLGRRVRRRGGRRRGRKLSDMLAQLASGEILVIDCKATSGAFDASIAELRPLLEYTRDQIARQRGQDPVFGALVISSAFKQDEDALLNVSREFFASVRTPVSFCEASVLAFLISECRRAPTIRNGVSWPGLFAGGQVTLARSRRFLETTRDERISRG